MLEGLRVLSRRLAQAQLAQVSRDGRIGIGHENTFVEEVDESRLHFGQIG